MKLGIGVLGLLLSGATQAATVTIDFEEFAEGFYDHPLSSQGYSFTSGDDLFVWLQTFTDRALFHGPTATMTVANEAAVPFALHSFDYRTGLAGLSSVTITGFYAAGGTISTTLDADETFDTYLFDAAWAGLDSFVIGATSTGTPAGIDNLVVSAIPVPAAVWLFGSALAGLGWLRRRQTV